MTQEKKSNIDRIKDVLQLGNLVIQETPNGIRIDLDSSGFPGNTIEFYSLKNDPKQIRAKVVSEGQHSSLKEEDLEFIRHEFQESLHGAGHIEQFHSFGRRGDKHIYYAQLSMDDTAVIIAKPKVKDPVEEALVQLKGVDSKMFRQGLDNLGLKRSSIVRLSLTRIFRESIDSDSLKSTITEEADKIHKSEERVMLYKLKLESKIVFLNNLILLLYEAVEKK